MGKGSGGGGAGSGAISHAAYMETFHEAMIGTGAAFTTDLTAVMEAALGASPFAGAAAYDPDADITALVGASTTMQTLVSLLSAGTTLDTVISGVLDDDRVDDEVTEYAADLAAIYAANELPMVEAGYRDINMVVSSAFVIGRANLLANLERQVGKFSAGVHSKAFSDDAIQIIGMKLEYQKAVSQMIIEAYRLKIVAKKEETAEDLSIDESDAKWDLEVFQFGANALAGIGGGISGTDKKPTLAQSVIGGAMSGAAGGALVGGWPGAIIGGLFGAATGLL
jgi:hypothetical protein